LREGVRGDSVPPGLAKHRVIEADTLVSIAQDYYGLERLWVLIWDRNKGMADHHVRIFEDPDRIYPGWILEIPCQQNRQTPDSREAAGGQR
jgi:nucleoid-associated protein YgaU